MNSLLGEGTAGHVALGDSLPQNDDVQLFLVPSNNSPFGNMSIVKLTEITGAGLVPKPVSNKGGGGRGRGGGTSASRAVTQNMTFGGTNFFVLAQHVGHKHPSCKLTRKPLATFFI